MTGTHAMLAGAWCLFGIMIVVALNVRRRRLERTASLQWTKEEIEKLKSVDRPPIIYNRIKPKDGMT